MRHYAIFHDMIVTANIDSSGRLSIPLNAKVGEAVNAACVEQANHAQALAFALGEIIRAERAQLNDSNASVYKAINDAKQIYYAATKVFP